MKKVLSVLFILCFTFTMSGTAFANVKQAHQSDDKVKEYIVLSTNMEIKGAPVGVTFGNETTANGSYAIEGTTVTTAVSALTIAIGVTGVGAYLTLAVTTAIGAGASHVYWVKKIAYGEDDTYYYTRTKVRLYSDSAHTKPLGDWKTVYHKKSKASGASLGEMMS